MLIYLDLNNFIFSKNVCSPPLQCIDGTCRPQACYSKRDCTNKQEKCLKWPEFQASGICYNPYCDQKTKCPPGLVCDQQHNICIRALCEDGKDCCRFKCQDEVYNPEKCTNDFECGYKASLFEIKVMSLIIF